MAQRGTPEPAEWRLGQLIAGPGDVGKVAGVTDEGFGLVPGGGGGGDTEGLLPAAVPFTTTTMPNTVTGTGDITVVVLPEDSPVLAVALDGDDWPRVVINADPSDFGGIFFGDGTFDPVDGGGVTAGIGVFAEDLHLYAGRSVDHPARGKQIGLDGPVTIDAQGDSSDLPAVLRVVGDAQVGFDSTGGVILFAPNGTRHRIKVANDGTLSTEVVA